MEKRLWNYLSFNELLEDWGRWFLEKGGKLYFIEQESGYNKPVNLIEVER